MSAQQHVTTTLNKPDYHWRPIDITIASVIAVASGLVFWVFDLVVTAPSALLSGVLPGLEGILSGFWYFAGVIAALIIRKPGAALYTELVAAVLEMLLGNQWGFSGTIVAGLVQGAFTELAFLILLYKRWNIWSAIFAGVLTGLAGSVFSFLTTYAGVHITGGFALTNIIANCISGALISGALMWLLYLGIARTGALGRFASGRTVTGTV
ncbi:ECF transporter S component [Bifidobacterium sp.]|jgi:energy-coupling factor transport system substrate-specific component|uniref:ECF transporter S component n=1 Tax=Bifidobacterium sp. TaxID=41200 RepID=UPI0025C17B56|nr:ECF transporter S component [Bifidobacterium sp.]MCI1635976.1 ECF transporter S component [Bifidobacterium sp.]